MQAFEGENMKLEDDVEEGELGGIISLTDKEGDQEGVSCIDWRGTASVSGRPE